MKEHEYKYLIKEIPQEVKEFYPLKDIVQGYPYNGKDMRVRIVDKKEATQCIKFPTINKAIRDEFEYSIPVADAWEILARCERIVEKKRYSFNFCGNDVFIDIYPNGLIIGEIEVKDTEVNLVIPDYFGKNVTGKKKYKNKNLGKKNELRKKQYNWFQF